MTDRDGLWLYRCFRGTNLAESMHQVLTMSFGHTRAGPRYSDNLLALVRHRFNWRASERNRPHFPQVRSVACSCASCPCHFTHGFVTQPFDSIDSTGSCRSDTTKGISSTW